MSVERLLAGLECGFVDRTIDAESEFIPQFLTNDPTRKEKVITAIKHEMNSCDEFWFSVAFATDDGVNALLTEFKRLRDDKINGKILVSQYQNFTQPKALDKLRTFPNIELRIVTEEQMKMHSKCYIFRKGENYDLIIGSSNLTNNALCSNGEWNLKVNSSNSGEVISSILKEFEKVFKHATPIDDTWLGEYNLLYNEFHEFRNTVKNRAFFPFNKKAEEQITPNIMQAAALKNIEQMREEGKDRVLIISATGSGKTYLSAFDAKIFGGKYLYLVHRKPILEKSMKSFRRVLGNEASIEKYDPERNNLNAQFIFSTIQTMSMERVLKKIPSTTFDYILIDEVHHAGGKTYQEIIKHFKPKFLMGMTATPDRTDDFDIYNLFNYNIAYEIRLKQAIELNLVCPFHYFGIGDILIDNKKIEEKTAFANIELNQRIDHIIKNAEYYGFSGNRVKGLVFCPDLATARIYSALFNRRGYHTAPVSGEMDKKEVELLIERLEADEGHVLDYIFTADLFNEGVDIPSVNQVIMLRPTESPVVYIQQLGRGLRLYKDKDYLVILDFIGNYERNYNIPLALSDDHSYNKAETRRFVETGDNIISGNSTISFDEVSKKRIYEAIDHPSFGNKKTIHEEYKNLKKKLGRIPQLIDFKKYGSVEPSVIISEYNSYYLFLKTKEEDYHVVLSKEQESILNYLSKIIVPGKRFYEIEVLEMINGGVSKICDTIRKKYSCKNPHLAELLISLFDGTFYKASPIILSDGEVLPSYLEMLTDKNFRNQMEDIIEVGRINYNEWYTDTYEDTDFVLYRQYNYDDVCRLLNWKQNVVAQNIGGYKYDKYTNTFPIFINYIKDDSVHESIRYEDRFENRRTLIGISKSTETVGSKNMTRIEFSNENRTTIHLFVRKNKNDPGAKEFYYLGKMNFEGFLSKTKPCKIRYRLKNEVQSDIYKYLTN